MLCLPCILVFSTCKTDNLEENEAAFSPKTQTLKQPVPALDHSTEHFPLHWDKIYVPVFPTPGPLPCDLDSHRTNLILSSHVKVHSEDLSMQGQRERVAFVEGYSLWAIVSFGAITGNFIYAFIWEILKDSQPQAFLPNSSIGLFYCYLILPECPLMWIIV